MARNQSKMRAPRSHTLALLFLIGLLTVDPLVANAQTTIIKNINKTVTKTININGALPSTLGTPMTDYLLGSTEDVKLSNHDPRETLCGLSDIDCHVHPRRNNNVVAKTVTIGTINNNGASTGDPLIRAFDNSLFFFHGEPGRFYNMLSEQGAYQVSTLLKEANNAVHIGSAKNGTYMQAIGFVMDNARIEVETFAHDSSRIIVKVNGEPLSVSDMLSLSQTRSVPLTDGGEVNVTFSLFNQHDGTVVNIVSPLMTMGVSLVPPGLDAEGYWQPSYLNINVTLLSAPEGTLEGVIGDTYHINGNAFKASTADAPDSQLPSKAADLVYPVFPDMAYELPSLFERPNYHFTPEFIHGVINMRREAAMKIVRASPNYS